MRLSSGLKLFYILYRVFDLDFYTVYCYNIRVIDFYAIEHTPLRLYVVSVNYSVQERALALYVLLWGFPSIWERTRQRQFVTAKRVDVQE